MKTPLRPPPQKIEKIVNAVLRSSLSLHLSGPASPGIEQSVPWHLDWLEITDAWHETGSLKAAD